MSPPNGERRPDGDPDGEANPTEEFTETVPQRTDGAGAP
jgi:hypothetical protein